MELNGVIFSRPRRTAAAAVFIFTFAVYLLTLAPTYSWGNFGNDGADLAAAVAANGIPHPPGFPLYLLIGKLFSTLPFGDFVWRLNLLSAVAASATSAVLFMVIRKFVRSTAVSLAAVGVYSFAALPWSQATITEVTSLLALFSALAIYFSVDSITQNGASSVSGVKPFILACLASGLAMAVHPFGVFAALTVASTLLCRARRPRVSHMLLGLIAAAIPLSLYLLVIVRSRAGSDYQWVNTSTLADFWWYISLHQYWDQVPNSVWSYLQSLGRFANAVLRNMFGIGAAVVVAGLAHLYRTSRRQFIYGAVAITAFALPVLGHANNPVAPGYYSFVLLPWTLAIGVGLQVVVDWVSRPPRAIRSAAFWLPLPFVLAALVAPRPWGFVCAALVVAFVAGCRRYLGLASVAVLSLPLILLAANWRLVDVSHDDRFKVLIREIDSSIASPAVVLILSGDTERLAPDALYFSLGYGLRFDRPRPDVVVAYQISLPRAISALEERYPAIDWSALKDQASPLDVRLYRFTKANGAGYRIYLAFGFGVGFDKNLHVGSFRLRPVGSGLLYEPDFGGELPSNSAGGILVPRGPETNEQKL